MGCWYFVALESEKESIFKNGWKGQRLYGEVQNAVQYFKSHYSCEAGNSRIFEVDPEKITIRQIGGRDNFGKYLIASQIPPASIMSARSVSKSPPTPATPEFREMGTEVIDVDFNPYVPRDPNKRVIVKLKSRKQPIRVYISHPVSGDIDGNTRKILNICRQIHNDERIPVVPYLVALQYLKNDIPEERQHGMLLNFEYFRSGFVDEVWLYGDNLSENMKVEVEWAQSQGIPVVAKSEATKKALLELLE